MENLFQFIAYMFFGKRYIRWTMIQGVKMAIFVDEVEIDRAKAKRQVMVKLLEDTEKELKEVESTEVSGANSDLDNKEKYEADKKIKEERKIKIATLQNRIKQARTEVEQSDGALAQCFSQAYQDRVKYDFLRGYKIKDTYADLNK